MSKNGQTLYYIANSHQNVAALRGWPLVWAKYWAPTKGANVLWEPVLIGISHLQCFMSSQRPTHTVFSLVLGLPWSCCVPCKQAFITTIPHFPLFGCRKAHLELAFSPCPFLFAAHDCSYCANCRSLPQHPQNEKGSYSAMLEPTGHFTHVSSLGFCIIQLVSSTHLQRKKEKTCTEGNMT